MDNNYLIQVKEHVKDYLGKYLPQYSLLEVRSKSYHPDDSHLFMVSAKREDGTYTVWTSWNEKIKSLNYGHYDLKSAGECEKIFEEFYHSKERGGAI